MSEYQYYEFQAIDRPLAKDEMAELRNLSTRATITSTRFVNVYHYGNVRGDPLTLEPAANARTVGELIAAAEERAEARRREEAEREAKARAAYLGDLVSREDDVWREVDALIETKRSADYDRAVALLADLRDLSLQHEASSTYAARLSALRARHAKKPSFLSRLRSAGL